MYFSDRENGVATRTSEEISIPVWNGIVSIFEEYKNKNYFSENFSEICSDNNQACGFDGKLFEARLQSEVPNIEKPIQILKNTIRGQVITITKSIIKRIGKTYPFAIKTPNNGIINKIANCVLTSMIIIFGIFTTATSLFLFFR